MQSDDLSCKQADALRSQVGPMLGYLNRLQRRMVRRRFPPNDPLLRLVIEAAAAMHKLHVDLLYRSCGNVTTRRSVQNCEQVQGDARKDNRDQHDHQSVQTHLANVDGVSK